ncbi:MAG: hypothetical protein LBD98_03405 [Endomicrobium sp.]|nr:hypothetical protein [Endomicrobium sp.]
MGVGSRRSGVILLSTPPINNDRKSSFSSSLEVVEDNFPNWQKVNTIGSIIGLPSALSFAAYHVRHSGYRKSAVGMSAVSILTTAVTAIYVVPSILSFFSSSGGLGIATGTFSLIWSFLPSKARDVAFRYVKGLGITTAISAICEFGYNKITGKSL